MFHKGEMKKEGRRMEGRKKEKAMSEIKGSWRIETLNTILRNFNRKKREVINKYYKKLFWAKENFNFEKERVEQASCRINSPIVDNDNNKIDRTRAGQYNFLKW